MGSLEAQKYAAVGINPSAFKDLPTIKTTDAVSDVITINAENIILL